MAAVTQVCGAHVTDVRYASWDTASRNKSAHIVYCEGRLNKCWLLLIHSLQQAVQDSVAFWHLVRCSSTQRDQAS